METVADDTIILTISLNAPIENVWNAWTDPALVLKWFGSDPNGRGLSATLDVCTGGSFAISFCDADQTEHTAYGVYIDVQKWRKLVFTWTWESEPGVESLVTVSLSPEDNGTKQVFQHTHVGTVSAHNYRLGWQSTFAKLDQMLSNEPDNTRYAVNH